MLNYIYKVTWNLRHTNQFYCLFMLAFKCSLKTKQKFNHSSVILLKSIEATASYISYKSITGIICAITIKYIEVSNMNFVQVKVMLIYFTYRLSFSQERISAFRIIKNNSKTYFCMTFYTSHIFFLHITSHFILHWKIWNHSLC